MKKSGHDSSKSESNVGKDRYHDGSEPSVVLSSLASMQDVKSEIASRQSRVSVAGSRYVHLVCMLIAPECFDTAFEHISSEDRIAKILTTHHSFNSDRHLNFVFNALEFGYDFIGAWLAIGSNVPKMFSAQNEGSFFLKNIDPEIAANYAEYFSHRYLELTRLVRTKFPFNHFFSFIINECIYVDMHVLMSKRKIECCLVPLGEDLNVDVMWFPAPVSYPLGRYSASEFCFTQAGGRRTFYHLSGNNVSCPYTNQTVNATFYLYITLILDCIRRMAYSFCKKFVSPVHLVLPMPTRYTLKWFPDNVRRSYASVIDFYINAVGFGLSFLHCIPAMSELNNKTLFEAIQLVQMPYVIINPVIADIWIPSRLDAFFNAFMPSNAYLAIKQLPPRNAIEKRHLGLSSQFPVFTGVPFSAYIPQSDGISTGSNMKRFAYFQDSSTAKFSDICSEYITRLSGRTKNKCRLIQAITLTYRGQPNYVIHCFGYYTPHTILSVCRMFPMIKFAVYDPAYASHVEDFKKLDAFPNVRVSSSFVTSETVISILSISDEDPFFISDIFTGNVPDTVNTQLRWIEDVNSLEVSSGEKLWRSDTRLVMKFFCDYAAMKTPIPSVILANIFHSTTSTECAAFIKPSEKLSFVDSHVLDDRIVSFAMIEKRSLYPNDPIHEMFKVMAGDLSSSLSDIDCVCWHCTSVKRILVHGYQLSVANGFTLPFSSSTRSFCHYFMKSEGQSDFFLRSKLNDNLPDSDDHSHSIYLGWKNTSANTFKIGTSKTIKNPIQKHDILGL